MPVYVSPSDGGTVVINKDGTYKFSHTDGTVSSGKVKLGFYTIGGQVFQSIQNKLLNK